MRNLILMMLAIGTFTTSLSYGAWDGDGTYYFDSGTLVETAVSDNATLHFSGGEITSKFLCLDSSTLYMTGGSINSLSVRDSSTANLMGGDIFILSVDFPETDLEINLFVEDYIFNPDSYIGYDNLSGIWLNSGAQFEILLDEGTFPYLTFVPEPTTLILFGLSGVFVIKERFKTRN